jgi:membrane protein required for colicin V production
MLQWYNIFNMAWFDYLVLSFIGIPFVLGVKIGLVRVSANLFGIIGGVFLGIRFADDFSQVIQIVVKDESLSNPIAFIFIFVTTILIAWTAATFLKKILSLLLLGWIDRIGGGFFGGMVGSFLVGGIIFIMELSSNSWAKDSLESSKTKPFFEFLVEFIDSLRQGIGSLNG